MPVEANPYIPLFDVDGVITNPFTKKPNPILLEYIKDRLNRMVPVGLASTRDFAWVEANVISPIIPGLTRSALDELFISTEKSAVTTMYKGAEVVKEYDESLRVPAEIGRRLEERIRRHDAIFYYPKETLFTAEVYEGGDRSEQDRQLDELNQWVQTELTPPGSELKADRTAIAIDIYNRRGSKVISARKFIMFLEQRGYKPQDCRFITIGDGFTDLEMADGVRDSGLEVEFGWVGEKPLQEARGHKVLLPTTGRYDLGTISILQQIGELV